MTAHLSARDVEKRARRFDKKFRKHRRLLTDRYGAAVARQITGDARREYPAVLRDTPKFAGRGNIFNWAIGENALIVAFHRAMTAAGKTADETIAIAYAVTERTYDAQPRVVRSLIRRIMFGRVFFATVRRSARLVGQHPEGWQVEYRQGDGVTSDWYFAVTECGVLKYYDKFEVPELAPYCNFVDYLQSRACGFGMQNPTNLGQGDATCVQLMKRDRETPVPANLEELAGSR
ncbi:MAG: hypothetical protein AAFP84_04960 [Actinomycetota bacterium]